MVRHFLSHPLSRSMDLNDPRMTLLHRQIIQEKRFLRKIYQDMMPDWAFGLWRWLESSLNPWMNKIAVFALMSALKKLPSRSGRGNMWG